MEIPFFIIMLIWTVGGAILINKSTESGGFDWIKGHLRISWMAYLSCSTAIILFQPLVWRFVVNTHKQWSNGIFYILCFIFGGLIFVGYFWFADKTAKSAQNKTAVVLPEQPKQPTAEEIAKEVKREMLPTGVADQRPWVDFDVKIIGPLSYDNENGMVRPWWHIGLEYQLRNTGKTPADDVKVTGSLIPLLASVWPKEKIKNGVPQGLPEPGTDVDAELKKLCNSFMNMMSMIKKNKAVKAAKMLTFSGELVFPDKPVIKYGIFGENQGSGVFEAAKAAHGYSGQFVLLMCVTYHSNLDNNYHTTGKAFLLFKRKNSSGKYPDIALNGEKVPVEELLLVHSPLGGDFAD
jgi:hypothetical protein